MNYQKAPFPWFGGKTKAAPAVWAALGNVDHYVEPFAGSLANLILRPHEPNRTYHSETVNDLDGLLVNVWRSIQMSPEATAEAASWPVTEADVHARHCALVRWRAEQQLEHLMGDPLWHDPIMAGWWLYGQCAWIGSGWCSGRGPWAPDETGRLVRSGGGGVNRKRPHLGDDGMGVHRPQMREAGIHCKRPHLGNDGQGVHRPQMREAGADLHAMTMPELLRWFDFLSARLRHVRIVNGSWERVCTSGALKILSVRGAKADKFAGVFLDPPYRVTGTRDANLYAEDEGDKLSADVYQWCLEFGAHDWLRIVLAGFEGEHDGLTAAGWREVEWYEAGFLQGGMNNARKAGDKNTQRKERLWMSPACLDVGAVGAADVAPSTLFAGAAK